MEAGQRKMKQNTLIIIGMTGYYDAYLNVDMDEAIKRYAKKHVMPVDEVKEKEDIHSFTFEDEFHTYNAQEHET